MRTECEFTDYDEYNGYQIGYSNITHNLFISKDLNDKRFNKIEISSMDEAIEYVDNIQSETVAV